MLELLLDHSEMNALTALYISIYLGMMLKYMWDSGIECSFLDSISNPANKNIVHPSYFYQRKSCLYVCFILLRIVKYIRRKESSQDDSEGPISSVFA